MSNPVSKEEQLLIEAGKNGNASLLGAFVKLSGPGWLQSAITLGGGSLAGSLYLGVLAGYNLMWLQVVAMICGVIMLSAISYVTLSTGERPFQAINKHINPVLGWSWAIAVFMANVVWCMPQFALGTAAVQQNLLPGVLGPNGALGENASKIIICLTLFTLATFIIWSYDKGSKGIQIFETILKALVGVVVVSFFGVVLTMSFSETGLSWSAIFGGLIPDFSLFSQPAPALASQIAESANPDYWTNKLVGQQRDVMITAVATAVGINMTFLLPYSMLKKGWNRNFRGLSIFDLSTGLFIPFVIATGCVVIAAASQFHGKFDEAIVSGEVTHSGYNNNVEGFVDGMLQNKLGADAYSVLESSELATMRAAFIENDLTRDDKEIAAMLIKRDAFALAQSLEPLTGKGISQYIFGFGVLAMAISTIIILMLINGFTLCEMLNVPATGFNHRLGCMIAGVAGIAGPFLWTGKAKFWLAVPTSTFGMMLLPIAYLTFFFMMNSKSLLGDNLPRGLARWVWNGLMGIALSFAVYGASYAIWSKTMLMFGVEVRYIAIGLISILAVLAIMIQLKRTKQH